MVSATFSAYKIVFLLILEETQDLARSICKLPTKPQICPLPYWFEIKKYNRTIRWRYQSITRYNNKRPNSVTVLLKPVLRGPKMNNLRLKFFYYYVVPGIDQNTQVNNKLPCRSFAELPLTVRCWRRSSNPPPRRQRGWRNVRSCGTCSRIDSRKPRAPPRSVPAFLRASSLDTLRDYTLRGQSNVWRLPKYWTPTPSPPGECVPSRFWCGGRTHSLGGEGGGVSIFWKTPDTALYSTYVSTLSPDRNK